LLATVLLAIWGGMEAMRFHDPRIWALVLVAAGVAPLGWRKQSALLLAFVFAAMELLLVANVLDYGGGSRAFAAALALGALLIAAARLTEQLKPSFTSGAAVMAFFGFAGFFVCSYLLTFHDAADDLLKWTRRPGVPADLAAIHSWVMFALAAAAWLAIGWQALVRRWHVAVEEWLVPIALLYVYGLAALGTSRPLHALFVAASFNLILLGIAVMWMWRGCSESRLRPTVIGSLLLAAVVLARYFDLFDSLAARGLAFILLGGIFLAEAMYYRRNRRAGPATSEGVG
jgi:hypothetical protein